MRKKLKDCSIAELKRYCIKRKSMPSGCTRCKLFHKAEQWMNNYYCKMSATPDLYLTNVENNIILDIPKEI